jgi:soluble lytic murein transglycosylase-like protein
MRRYTDIPRLCVLGAAMMAAWSFIPGHPASADDVVPTPTVTVSTLQPTVPVATEIAPAATVQSVPPTAVRERSAPVATVAEQPTVGEGAAATAPPTRLDMPFSTATSVGITATPVPSAPQSPVPAEVPLPSPAQLRESARLRWGHGVPYAVSRWGFIIVPAAHRYNLSPGLIAAVMTMESGGDPLAYSPADARGLMQVLHGPWDPRQNVFMGARMLAEYHGLFPDWTLTLAAYNAGPNAVSAYNGVPPFRETRDYVIVVTYLWDLYSHKHLSVTREQMYHSTLKDLQRFSQERKKVRRLAQIAHIHDARLLCDSGCSSPQRSTLFATLDPFWPLATGPDPLQRVDPYSAAP